MTSCFTSCSISRILSTSNSGFARSASSPNIILIDLIKALKEEAKRLNGEKISVKIKCGENGKVFGSITAKEIAEVLNYPLLSPLLLYEYYLIYIYLQQFLVNYIV